MTRSRALHRLLAVLLAGLLPWTVVYFGGESTFVFSFGLVNTDPLQVVDLYRYLFVYTDGLPRRLQAWPVGVLLYAGALASAIGGLRALEDPRLTGGLLFFAGLAHAQVTYGLYRAYGPAAGVTVIPLGAILAWVVAWWYYWPLIRERDLGGPE
jgi:uncharacterized protein (TIGR04206 family)